MTMTPVPFDLDMHDMIIYTYDVRWAECPIRWASRWALTSSDEILKAFRLLDGHETGSDTVSFEEFFEIKTHKILNQDTEDEILEAFRLTDDHETGTGTIDN